MALTCRYYAQKLPELDDVVLVNVRSIQEMGVYVDLLEYDGIEGMIPLAELSRRRIRSINKLVSVGRNEFAAVIRVDKDKGYIDLSRRRVSEEDVAKASAKLARMKTVRSILGQVAENLHYNTVYQLEELHSKTAWHFDEKYKKQTVSYDLFKQAVRNPSVLNECDLDNDTKTALLAEIRQKLTVRGTKVRAYMEVACFGYDGIDAVKEALRAGLTLSTDDCPIKINLIVPPTYVLTTTAARQADGAKLLNNAMKLIEVAIQKKDMGKFRIQLAPTAVTETDENAFTQRLGQLDRENQEVSGDDDSNSN